jgi:hypothetical protein
MYPSFTNPTQLEHQRPNRRLMASWLVRACTKRAGIGGDDVQHRTRDSR